uniref:Reverse transcriptase domain-containing protein n=1 Tax=Fagus sylvatica TaxID=28930 RepID=A0A2N9F1Y5_FAGSY
MVRNYHKDKGIPRCTIKLDLLKADDSLEWEFTLHCQSTIADKSSIQLVKGVLSEFQNLSGLAASPKKSEVFCANVPYALKSRILE